MDAELLRLYGLAAFVVGLAAVVRGATGFGFALVAALGLSALWPPAVATPVVFMLELVVTIGILRGGAWREVTLADVGPLMAGGLAGGIAGVLLVSGLPDGTVKLGLDLVVLVSAAASLARLKEPRLDRPLVAAGVGVVTGAVISAFAVGGPLVVAWLLATGRSPARMRAALTVYFGLTDALGLGVRLLIGRVPAESWTAGAVLLPIALIGTALGGHIFRRTAEDRWRRFVALMLILIAAFSLARTLGLLPAPA